MGRRKTKHPLIEGLEIIDAGAEGKAVGKYKEKVVFVPYVVPGDVITAQAFRKRKNYLEASAVSIEKYSDKRTDPICEHFGVCGGCKWQNMKYEEQLHYKQNQVEQHLNRIGKLELPKVEPILSSVETDHYRNKLEFTFSNSKWLTKEEIESGVEVETRNGVGFHIPGKFDKVLDINRCHLQGGLSNEVRDFIKAYALEKDLSFYNLREHSGLLRNLIIRNTNLGETMVIVCFGAPEMENIDTLMQAIDKQFPGITSLLYVINEKKNDTISDQDIICFKGRDHILEEMEGLKFKISAKSFFQTNSTQALELYRIARDFANIQPTDLVYDLYTGTGTIANFVASKAKHVVGIEYVPEAIEDARINSANNKVNNTSFFAGDMKDLLTSEFIAEHGKPDVLITDPPRAGMHADVVTRILEAEPPVVVYVSCNAATQARDLQLMDHKYKVTKVQPVDMFPHTHHVENVVKLELR